jgi:LemA protein
MNYRPAAIRNNANRKQYPQRFGGGRSFLWAGLALLVGLAIWGISVNISIVSLDEQVSTSLANVEGALQRRYDLIPNLVAAVKGYATHEKELLEEITRLRSQWQSAGSTADKERAAGLLESAIGRLIVVAENYPELKANQSFRDLQVSLEGAENRVNNTRRLYNEALQDYNTKVRQFPGSVVAGFRGFTPKEAYFKADEKAKDAPKVEF